MIDLMAALFHVTGSIRFLKDDTPHLHSQGISMPESEKTKKQIIQ
jgi:hypothetical protein